MILLPILTTWLKRFVGRMYFWNLGMEGLTSVSYENCTRVRYSWTADWIRRRPHGRGAYFRGVTVGYPHLHHAAVSPFTPKSDQRQISPVASAETLQHAVWTWLFIASSDERGLYYQFSLPRLYIFSLKCWEDVLFALRSARRHLKK